MLRNIVIGFLVLALCACTTTYDSYGKPQRGSGNGDVAAGVVVGVIGGLILGEVIDNDNNRARDRRYQRQCYNDRYRDRRGRMRNSHLCW